MDKVSYLSFFFKNMIKIYEWYEKGLVSMESLEIESTCLEL